MAKHKMADFGKVWAKRASLYKVSMNMAINEMRDDIERTSREELRSKVPNAKALVNAESAARIGDGVVLTNTAHSTWKGTKTYYGWIVAYGRSAMDKGKRYFAWMKDPSSPRPTSLKDWFLAVRRGSAVMAHRVRAVRGRDWRKSAANKIRKELLPRIFGNAVSRVMK